MLDTHAHNLQHIHKQRLVTRKGSFVVVVCVFFWGGLIMSNNLQTCYHSATYVWIVPLYWMRLCWWYRRWSPVWRPSWMCLPSLKSLESRMPTLLSGLYMQVYLLVWLMWSGFFFFSRLQESSECMFAVDIIRLNYWEISVLLSEFQRTLDYKVSSQNLTWPKNTKKKGHLTIRYHLKISPDQKRPHTHKNQ